MTEFATFTASEEKTVQKIVKRAVDLGLANRKQQLDVRMYLAVGHQRHPLDLERLLTSRDQDFIHDVSGIITKWDRKTGDFIDFWTPRHAI